MVGRCEFKQIWPQAVSTMGDIERFGLEENIIGRKKCSRKINVRREFLFLFIITRCTFCSSLFPISTLSSCQDHGCDCVWTSTMLLLFFLVDLHQPSSIVHRPSSTKSSFLPPRDKDIATTEVNSTHPTQYTVRCWSKENLFKITGV